MYPVWLASKACVLQGATGVGVAGVIDRTNVDVEMAAEAFGKDQKALATF